MLFQNLILQEEQKLKYKFQSAIRIELIQNLLDNLPNIKYIT